MDLARYWRIIRQQKRPVRFVVGHLLMRSGLSPLVRLRQKGFSLRFYPSAISLNIWQGLSGAAHPSDLEVLFRSYLKPGDTVIDVGANIGYYSLLASVLVGEAGHVYAIEAHPRVFRYLQGNLALNKVTNMDARHVALGDKEGTLRFSDIKADDMNRVVEDGAGIEVAVRRLDDLKISSNRIAILKVDVEGYEFFVLRGAAGLLKNVECVVYESWEDHFSKYGRSGADVVGLLSGMGFRVVRFAGERIEPVPQDCVSRVCEDLLAVRDLSAFLKRTGWRMK